MGRIVMPTTDLGFEKILASTDHKNITRGFIADFFGLSVNVDDIHIVNPYSIQPADGPDGQRKLTETFRDITVEIADADLCLEMQVVREANFVKRALYYMDDLYTSRYKAGRGKGRQRRRPDGLDRYAILRPVWSMNVLAQPGLDCEHPFHMFRLHDVDLNESLVPELVRLGFFELSKPGASAKLARWRDFLTSGVAQGGDPDYLHEAASIIEYVNFSTEERHMADLHEKFIADRDSGLYWAKQDGIKQGLEQGLEHTARELLRRGLSHDDIVAITGLDGASVDRLAEELGLVDV